MQTGSHRPPLPEGVAEVIAKDQVSSAPESKSEVPIAFIKPGQRPSAGPVASAGMSPVLIGIGIIAAIAVVALLYRVLV
ncbi:hypothetical protein [Pararhizobium sp.]|uniref:hypothetical protein n=1 Tax=Pararhizobium sp. TaxID=1977563 RepID=UPI00271F5302|nr:hypothetical protein [Pararhizobium sp.]MDO9417626.1 hypothetical protein [Pararhizobium sp.]